MMNTALVIVVIIIILVVVGKKSPSKSTTSVQGADEGAPQPTPQETVVTPTESKELKKQTMNNATLHYFKNTNNKPRLKEVNLGTLTFSGELKHLGVNCMAKDQGYGNKCSSFEIRIVRGEDVIHKLSHRLARTTGYVKVQATTTIDTSVLVEAGDSVVLVLRGWYPSCSTWIKDIVTDIHVLA